MIVALCVPAYRQQIHVRAAYAWAQDSLTCAANGWSPALIWADNTGVARARNRLVQEARGLGADLLLTCDADTFPLPMQGGLDELHRVMVEQKAAVVGAAVTVRNGSGMNCAPAKPGEIYEGVVGTGYMLIDLRALADLPEPWFVHEDTLDGLEVACGEDVYFCRHARAHGHKVFVHFALPMGHADGSVSATPDWR